LSEKRDRYVAVRNRRAYVVAQRPPQHHTARRRTSAVDAPVETGARRYPYPESVGVAGKRDERANER
jgi:hypothetical protein